MYSMFDIVIISQHFLTSLIGIIGNLLVLIVYKNKLKDNETITFFIIHLAITDFLCCVLVIPINCYHELNIGRITSDFMCKFHSFLNIINITYSCLLMTLVAFERFFSIVYPIKKLVTKKRAKIIMLILLILCIIIGLVGCLGIGIYHKVHRVFSLNNSSIIKDSIINLNETDIELKEAPTAVDYLIKREIKRKNNSELNHTPLSSKLFLNRFTRNLSENQDELAFDYNDHLNQEKIVITEKNKTNLSKEDQILLNNSLDFYLKDNLLIELYRVEDSYGNKKFYYTIRERNSLFFNDTLRDKRQANIYENMTSLWMPTNNCFPNDKLISIRYFPFIRLFQNLIVVICFSFIFILYAFLCIVVSKRRHLKASRENYYREILQRSKQNTIVKNEISTSRNNSFMNCLPGQNEQSFNNSKNLKKNNNPECYQIRLRTDSLNSVNFKENAMNSQRKKVDFEETKFSEKCKKINDLNNDLNCNKSTQTKTSSIASIKYARKKRRNRKSFDSIKKKPKFLKTDEKNENDDNNLFRLNNNSFKMKTQNALIANLKTAFMLFVVTLVMAIVYTPALLTSIGYIEYNPIHWNIIYINNAVNPLIYSFLNSNFRKNLFKFFSNN